MFYDKHVDLYTPFTLARRYCYTKLKLSCLNIRKQFFYCEGNQTLAQVDKGGIQKPSGCAPGQPALDDSV